MKQFLQQVDRLLRGKEQGLQEESLEQLRFWQLLIAGVVLAAIYGFFMGWYAVFSRPEPEWRQVVASSWKVPALFGLTLFTCFPSLYVFSALAGSRLSCGAMLKLLIAVVVMTVTVLASFGPIVGFFTVSTENYPFMKLMNIAFFGVAGVIGLAALLRALSSLLAPGAAELKRLVEVRPDDVTMPPPNLKLYREAALSGRRVNRLFRIWVVICVLVGAQMSWVLRPLIGDPQSPFVWFSHREGNFLNDLMNTINKLFS